MNTVMRIATAFATGAAAMYFLDPVAGGRRRALVRDKGVAARHGLEDFAEARARRAADKARGLVAETRAALASAPVGDVQLHDRIRSRLGRLVDAPGEVKVDVQSGNVVLRGTASADEIDDVLATVSGMRGVAGIDNHLVARASGFREFDTVAGDLAAANGAESSRPAP